MVTKKVCSYFNTSESSVLSAFFSFIASSLAVGSLISYEWLIIEDDSGIVVNGTSIFPRVRPPGFCPCRSIGTRHFWRAPHFSVIVDSEGERHDIFRTNGETWIDCITPLIANYFYILIALCFVIIFASSFASALNIFMPPFGFFVWLRKNTLLEVCSMALSLMACVTLLLAECQYVPTIDTGVTVSIGPGLFLIAASGVASFFAAAASLRRSNRLASSRRLQNQQLLCARSLLSWRDVSRQPEDMQAILQFEEYLDSSLYSPTVSPGAPTAKF